MKDDTNRYGDIIDMPHHVSAKRRQMTLGERAGQFSAFAALTGLDDKMDETARLTDTRLEPDDDRIARIDACLQYLIDNAADMLEVTVVYFVADELKSGGEYRMHSGTFRRIDEYGSFLVLTDGLCIPIQDIWEISAEGLVIT
ncbi:MAG: hypothetical protein MJ079_05535 [Ruminococcus sp.]|nr:hypothetical protein [Ruminococcus sp.]